MKEYEHRSQPAGQPMSGGVNKPELQPPQSGDMFQRPYLSLREELLQRMTAANTTEPVDVVKEEWLKRWRDVHASLPPNEATAKTIANSEQGRRWRRRQEELGLTYDEVARKIGISPWELFMTEEGAPPLEGLPEDVTAKLDEVLLFKKRPK